MTITKHGNTSTFVLDERIVNRIIDFIAFELKNNAVEGMEEEEEEEEGNGETVHGHTILKHNEDYSAFT